MAILYKSFISFRTAFYIVVLSFFIGGAFPASADNSLFTVTNVKVDVKAKNSAIARESAFAKAKSKAFAKLSQRMLSEEESQSFFKPDSAMISTFIQDFEVTAEKISSVRYVGTYTFRFKDKPVREFFASQGVSYTDVSSRPVLVLPFYQLGASTVLFSAANDWMNAWNRAEAQQGLVPIVVPIGDLQDVSVFGASAALSYQKDKLTKMLKRYNAGEAVLLIAAPDQALSQVLSSDAPAVGALVIKIYRTDRNAPEIVQDVLVKARGNESKAQMFDRATLDVQKALQKNWKAKTIVSAGQGNHLQVRVHFTALDEWAETNRALHKAYGINDVILKSLSPKEARVELVFEGNERRLRLALAQAEITLSQPKVNFDDLYENGSNSRFPLIYELYLNRLKYKIELPVEQPKTALPSSAPEPQSSDIIRTPL